MSDHSELEGETIAVGTADLRRYLITRTTGEKVVVMCLDCGKSLLSTPGNSYGECDVATPRVLRRADP